MHPMWITFSIVYIGIALGRFPRLVLDRTGIALLGGIAMLVFHGVHITDAARHLDHETLLLMFGLMIFSAQLRVAGFYVTAGRYLTHLTHRPRLLLAGLIATSAGLSALLVNDIVCLAFTPLLCEALLSARRDPIPYLVALAASSNIGSAATLIGNPQNMYIGMTAKLPFGHFTLVMLPAVLVGLLACYLIILLIFRRRLDVIIEHHGRIKAHDGDTLVPTSLPLQTHAPQRDTYLIIKTLIILVGLLAFFLIVRGPRATELRAIAALAGAGLLLCSHRAKAAKLYQLVDWNLLLLFMGLFVVNGSMKQFHLTDQMMNAVQRAGLDLHHPISLAAVTAGLSNIVSNVPAVLLLEPSLSSSASPNLWYLTALISTWAGNLTLVGSIANLIVAESAAAFGVELDLKTYCKAGIPLTLITLILGTAWIMLIM